MVIGLGYVGLPLALSFAKAGYAVIGIARVRFSHQRLVQQGETGQ